LLTKANIKNYIDKRLKELEDSRIAKVDEVMKFLTSSLRGEVEEEVVSTMNTLEGETKPVIIKKQISARDRIKAAELIGKRYQLFTDKVNVEGNIGVTIIDDIGVEDD
jgi:phage terminase small subunit